MEKELYFKNLDASRFFAFLIVFLAHGFVSTDQNILTSNLYQNIYQWGKVGVLGLEYFFVLSSFLISFIFLREKKQSGKIHIPYFLIRRSLRVWPLYFLILLIGFVIVWAAPHFDVLVNPLPHWPYLFFFWVNFYIIEYGTEFLFFVAFLWSISVEEQFYVLWAFIMKFLQPRFDLFCWTLVAISILFRYYYRDDDARLFFHTISALGNFGIGGLLASALYNKKKWTSKIIHWKKSYVVFIYLIIFVSIALYHQLKEIEVFRVFIRLYFSLAFAYIILEQSSGQNHWFNFGKYKFISYLGKISYGLYCFHGVVITLLIQTLPELMPKQNYLETFFIFPIVILVTTFLLSHLSYRYFERAFLRMKDKFYTFKA